MNTLKKSDDEVLFESYIPKFQSILSMANITYISLNILNTNDFLIYGAATNSHILGIRMNKYTFAIECFIHEKHFMGEPVILDLIMRLQLLSLFGKFYDKLVLNDFQLEDFK